MIINYIDSKEVMFFSSFCCYPFSIFPKSTKDISQSKHEVNCVILMIVNLGTYFNCIMFMVASSVVLTVVVLNYHHRTSDNYEMPYWIRRIFLEWLPWILLIRRPGKKITLKTILHGDQTKKNELNDRLSKSLLANVLNIEDDFRLYSGGVSSGGDNIYLHHQETATTTSTTATNMSRVVDDGVVCSFPQKELHAILNEVQYITNKLRKAEEEADIISDWKFAAIVMDRFCLIIFTMFTIIATFVVLLSAPHIIVE